jgi:hypothetical protein
LPARAQEPAPCEDGAQASFMASIKSVDRLSETEDWGFAIILQAVQGTCSVGYVQIPGPEAPFACEAGHYIKASGLVTVDSGGTPFLKDPVDLSCQ